MLYVIGDDGDFGLSVIGPYADLAEATQEALTYGEGYRPARVSIVSTVALYIVRSEVTLIPEGQE